MLDSVPALFFLTKRGITKGLVYRVLAKYTEH
jgi:hypothetical protein